MNMNKGAFFISFLFMSLLLYARDVTVTVTDLDINLPLEGAFVRCNGREYVCDEEGKAIINAPDTRQAVIQAGYPGYETGRMVITQQNNYVTLGLRLSGVFENRELVVEGTKPGTGESRTGRSVGISNRDIAQTAEIGIIEDLMSSIKLLPGVGYTGFFNAQPSIRGGDPNDMSAALDGYYISNPYHWGGGFSIFDPKMVERAQLSHGVFSSRYGHTISGLLEVTGKKPSSTETQFELGINTSAANFFLSLPLGKGGILFMGRVTYYDPVIAAAKQLSEEIPELEVVNSVRIAPYIRSGTISGNYRFTDNLELTAVTFWGMDGVGVSFENISDTVLLNSKSTLDFDWTNYQGFFTSSLAWNPQNTMLLKFSAGAGYEEMVIDGNMNYYIFKKYFSKPFKDNFPELVNFPIFTDPYNFYNNNIISETDLLINAQTRIDYDWELNNNLLLASGIQGMFTQYTSAGAQIFNNELRYYTLKSEDDKERIKDLLPLPSNLLNNLLISAPGEYSPDAQNNLLSTSVYTLGEINAGKFMAELGIRIDYFVLIGKGFTLQSEPVINPRINLDYNIVKNLPYLHSLDISAGTGLFSSINNNVFAAEEKYDTSSMKPNRSWTSVFGIKFEFPQSINANIEFYYKYIFDRMYVPLYIGLDDLEIKPCFDGEGRVWGIDLMLQKITSRYWDGWLSYSYNWVNYRDPQGRYYGRGLSGGNKGDDWYFPWYHRYHNLNLVFNVRPAPNMNIYTRFGLASGVQLLKRIGQNPVSEPVLVYNRDNPEKSYFIEKYYWPSVNDESNRTTPSLQMDIKFSIMGGNKSGKSRWELYVALENVLGLVYTSQGNTSFNQYTGEVDTGSDSANYEMPIPIPSFGFKLSY
jgi:hypothetical protein